MSLGKPLLCFSLILAGATAALAQQPVQDVTQTQPEPARVLKFELSKPKFVMDLGQTTGILGRFKCGASSSVLVELSTADGGQSNTSGHRPGHLELAEIKPDGQSLSFAWQSAPGYTRFSHPRDVFVRGGKIYVLTEAEKDALTSDGKRSPRIALILQLGADGGLKSVTPLDRGLDPMGFGVYGSGDYLIVSVDHLNRRLALSVLDSAGTETREIRLFDADTIQKGETASDKGSQPMTYSPDFLAATTGVYAAGENLLLVPHLGSGSPVVEVNESGIVRTTIPKLPKGTLIASFIPSTGRTFKFRLGSLRDDVPQDLDSDGHVEGVSIRPSALIAEIDPNDGSIVREIDAGSLGVQPACEADGSYTFLTAHREDGQLQIVQATLR